MVLRVDPYAVITDEENDLLISTHAVCPDLDCGICLYIITFEKVTFRLPLLESFVIKKMSYKAFHASLRLLLVYCLLTQVTRSVELFLFVAV